jgi:hypothetical protein
MQHQLSEIKTFSEYLEFKQYELRLTITEFVELLKLKHHRYNRLIYQKLPPTIEEVKRICEILEEKDLPWLLMLARLITPEMENILFSDAELYRNIYMKGNKK